MDQERIGKWHRACWPDCAPWLVGDKLIEEAEEVRECLDQDDYADPNLPSELADVAICLMAIADRAGVDLMDEVAKKFPQVEVKYAVPE
jgi:NTP pyrophosphatase (non-canonical NTP hydrolase)